MRFTPRIPGILIVLTAAAHAGNKPAITVEPAESLVDEAVRVRVSGLSAGQRFTIYSSTVDALGRRWSGDMAATAGPDGTLDLSRWAPAGAKYPDIESMRPFWSMRLDRPGAPPAFARSASGSIEVTLELRTEKGILATAKVRRDLTSPSVRVRDIHEDGVIGRMYEPERGTQRRPTVLVFSGSEGGFAMFHAGTLASYGYTTFALAYSRPRMPGAPAADFDALPEDGIEMPLEYVEHALDWLKRQPSVDPTRIAVTGMSKGAELALLIASLRPHDFKAVVPVSGSSVVWEGYFHASQPKDHGSMKPSRSSWSYRGKPLPFVLKGLTPESPERTKREEAGHMVDFYASGYRDKAAVERARIPVEKIEAPTLLVASEMDGAWNAAEMSRDVDLRMRAQGRRPELLIYPDSAHQITDAWLPPNPRLPERSAGHSREQLFAGTREGTIHASADSWTHIKTFLDANLKPSKVAIRVEPSESLIDEPVRIRVSGLDAGQRFTIHSSATDALGRRWSGEMTAMAGPHGGLDLSRWAPSGAKYPEIESMRPFWSMRLETPSVPDAFVRPASGAVEVALELRTNQERIAQTRATRYFTLAGIRVREIREEGLVGRVYEPSGTAQRRPAILVFTGSGGGISKPYAPTLASHGYVTFALAYSGIDPLPVDMVELPLEYVEKGLDWLKRQPSVDSTRIGVIGISKGAELALLIASLRPRDFRAVAAISPSSVVWEGGVRNRQAVGRASIKPDRSSWSYKGKPLAYLPKALTPETLRRIDREGSADTIDFYGPAYRDRTAVERAPIPVDNIAAPVLLIASEADRMWPAAEMARDVENSMRSQKQPCESLIYSDASHAFSDSWLPPVYGTVPTARVGRWDRASLGGTAEGTVHASTDSWSRVKAFFDANLRPSRAAITVEPVESLIDEAVRVFVTGLKAGQQFTIHSSAVDALGRRWSGDTTATAGLDGGLDLSRWAPAGAKYPEIECMRPFWSLRPETPALPAVFVRPASGSMHVLLELRTDKGTVATVKARRDFTSPSVRVREVRDEGLVGRFYLPENDNIRRPAVLVFTGSGGGIPVLHAGLLASHGYNAFALAYMGIPPLPVDGVEVPLEYVEKALDWLKRQPSVDPARIGVIGISKGAELSLLMATLRPRDFKAVVAVSPSSVVWEGFVRNPHATGRASMKPERSTWSYRGQPLPFLPKALTPEMLRHRSRGVD